ncbi:hypothetical protein MSHOH_2089 [Methanosarcina horonobensis HB-1 = JCM 15518]|uniref:Uncharacterized protein n=1 Tax=Methanosarcina horonobensis HB-1 = JCM 15518 TaxID=1434110 RepID=A0A0E3SEG3_9EURY|nr:hypothetical protein [Methanosarcina horonobensis]AKB78572.1 hypothetical protein MSHOH_2089 [Methanosarcina horonobensis HB-1 = JCM 15518]
MSTGRPFLLLTAESGFPFSFPPEGADRYDLYNGSGKLRHGPVIGVHADKLFWSDTLFVGHPFRFSLLLFFTLFLKNG